MLSQEEPRNGAQNFDTYRIIRIYDKSIMERLCTLNTAALSTRTCLAPKPAQNTLNHQRSFKVTNFRITEKRTKDCVLPWASESEISKERSEHLRFREPHCHSAPPVQGTPANIRTNLILLETIFILHWFSSSRRQFQILQVPFRVGTDTIAPSSVVRDLGIYLDSNLSMTAHNYFQDSVEFLFCDEANSQCPPICVTGCFTFDRYMACFVVC